MNENVEKILTMCKGKIVLSILESENNYIVSICDENTPLDEAGESMLAIDKKTFVGSRFSYFNNPDEYAEACNNVLYKHEPVEHSESGDSTNFADSVEDELTHWGIKGMRWGIRRYQNKDGTMTAAGKKRYNEELAKVRQEEKTVKNRTAVQNRLDRLTARQKAVAEQKKALDEANKKPKKEKLEEKPAQPKKKKMSEMDDIELANAIRRVQMEKQYEALTAEERVAKGDSFAKRFMEESVAPAIKDAGRTLIRDKLLQLGKEKLGLNEEKVPDYVEALSKEVKKLNLEKQYKNLKEEASKAAEKTADTPAAKQLKQDVADLKETVKQPIKVTVTKKTASSGESYVNNTETAKQPIKVTVTKKTTSSGENYVKNSGLESQDWQAFKSQYSWGVESYATDKVDG